ncbi:transglutaminase family protein [Novosphingobium lentum]|uniref:transglutaminase family protein n=1 Tax=Novosphingobium lentum TaxID=145287 RepID=UPI0008375496|nr:transglutaminase family protein [Novosphingobium lentum]
MRLAIDHITSYAFSSPVSRGLQRLRLTPKSTSGQRIVDWTMELEGATLEVEYDDHNQNHVTLIALVPGASRLVIRCHGVVETADESGIIGRHAGHLPLWYFLQSTPLTRTGPRLRSLAASLAGATDRVAMLHRLSDAIHDKVAYATGHTDADTTAEEALAVASGVCQDHAHIFIAVARAAGIPARYVSGYLMMDDRVNQEAGHAWAEAHVDGLGWVGFDVSNGICPDARYVRMATGRDYRDAAPITGIRFGTHEETMKVSLAVEQQRMEQ